MSDEQGQQQEFVLPDPPIPWSEHRHACPASRWEAFRTARARTVAQQAVGGLVFPVTEPAGDAVVVRCIDCGGQTVYDLEEVTGDAAE